MATRKELIEALRVRYRGANYGDRSNIFDEFSTTTEYHRKHAIRLLRDRGFAVQATPVVRVCVYDKALRQALTMSWEAADRVCGKRLKALIQLLVDAMERHGQTSARGMLDQAAD